MCRVSEAVGREVSPGKIVHGDTHSTLKVKTLAFASEVRKRIKDITALLAGKSPPDLVLNRHCGQCEFQTRCRTLAREKDELSLLTNRHIGQKSQEAPRQGHLHGHPAVLHISPASTPQGVKRQAGKASSFPAGACNPREQDPCGRHSGPKTRRHSRFSGCRRVARPRFLLLDRGSDPRRRRKRTTQFLGGRCKRGEADMERFPRRPFRDHKSTANPLRQL